MVVAAFKAIGIDLPRTTWDQVKTGQPIPIDANAIQPGDLIFTKDSEGRVNGHVGIASGNGKWISAPHTGATVHESNMPALSAITAIRRVL